MMKQRILIGLAAVLLAASGAAYAEFANPRTPDEFFAGHSHVDGQTIDAPEHSGGTDRWGCHNASVPYHCH